MKRGQILGEVWATRKAPGLDGTRLKLVALWETQEDRPNGVMVVAQDTLDARTGQKVLVAFGSGARNVIEPPGAGGDSSDNRHVLCDAAIALLLEED